MLEFTVFVSKRKLTETKELKSEFNKRSILTEIEDVTHFLFMNHQAVLLYKQKYTYQGNLVHIDGDHFTALVGYILSPKFTNHPSSIVKELHVLLSNNSDRAWLNACMGEFIIVYYNGLTLEVTTSVGATHLVYYRQSDDEILISNRLSLTNLSLMHFKPKINIKSQLQIIAYDSIFNEQTTFEESFCLERGYTLKLTMKHIPILEKVINSQFLGTTYIDKSEFALEEISEYTQWYLDHIRLFTKQVDIKGGMDFFLSGGKDSRLLLASFVETGFIHEFKQVVTFGSPGDADVQAAKLVANHYHLPHEIRPRSVAKNVFFERLPFHIYHMEGEINARILSGNYIGLRKAEFTGHEIGLREAFVHTGQIQNEDDLMDYIDHQLPIDPIGFMKQNTLDNLKQEIKEIYFKSIDFNINAQNFLNYFIIIGRGPRWAGKITSMNSAAGLYINLLINSKLLKLTHRIGVNNRNLHLTHLGMMKAIDKTLLTIPFAKQSWPDETLKLYKKKFKLPIHVISDDESNKDFNPLANQWWDAIYYKDNGNYMKKILHELRHPSLAPFIDYNIVNYYIDSAKNVSGRAMLSIYGLLSSSLVLHAGDIMTSRMEIMKDIVHQVVKSAEQGYKQSILTKNVIRLPINNLIYRAFFHQYPVGSDWIRLMTVKLENKIYEGIFVHSGHEVEINLPNEAIYEMNVKCIILPQVIEKCSEQLFEIINMDTSDTIYSYHFPNQENTIKSVKFKGKTIKLKVASQISGQYGWCLFVLDKVQFNKEVE